MKRLRAALIWTALGAAAVAVALAQAVVPSNLQYNWPAVATTGQLGSFIVLNGLNAPRPANYRVDWTVSGTAPSPCTFNVQGSSDNVTWTNLDGGSAVSCATSGGEVINSNPVLMLRVNVASYAAGDGTTKVTFRYTGSSAGTSSVPAGWICSGSGTSQVCTAPGTVAATTALACKTNGVYTSAGCPAGVFMGAWSSSTAYALGNVVTNGGQTFIAGVANTNVTPANGTTWYQVPSGATIDVSHLPTPLDVANVAALVASYNGNDEALQLGATGVYNTCMGVNLRSADGIHVINLKGSGSPPIYYNFNYIQSASEILQTCTITNPVVYLAPMGTGPGYSGIFESVDMGNLFINANRNAPSNFEIYGVGGKVDNVFFIGANATDHFFQIGSAVSFVQELHVSGLKVSGQFPDAGGTIVGNAKGASFSPNYAIYSIASTLTGSGYTTSSTVTFTGGTCSTNPVATVSAVNGSGQPTAFNISTPGVCSAFPTTCSFTIGTGATCSMDFSVPSYVQDVGLASLVVAGGTPTGGAVNAQVVFGGTAACRMSPSATVSAISPFTITVTDPGACPTLTGMTISAVVGWTLGGVTWTLTPVADDGQNYVGVPGNYSTTLGGTVANLQGYSNFKTTSLGNYNSPQVCTVMPDNPTPTFAPSVSAPGHGKGISALTATGNTGQHCLGIVDVAIVENFPSTYGGVIWATDSTFDDLLIQSVGLTAGIVNHGGNNVFIHPHCYVGQPICFQDFGGVSTILQAVGDNTSHYAVDCEAQGDTIIGTQGFVVSPFFFPGVSKLKVGASCINAKILDQSYLTGVFQADSHLLVTPVGPTDRNQSTIYTPAMAYVGVTNNGQFATGLPINLNFDGPDYSYIHGMPIFGESEASPIASLQVLNSFQLTGYSFIPTPTAGAGAGTSPTITMSTTSNNEFGQVTVLTGSSPTASAVVATITYNPAYKNGVSVSYCHLDPQNAAAAALSGTALVYAGTGSGTAFTMNVGSTALTGATTYIWTYGCGS